MRNIVLTGLLLLASASVSALDLAGVHLADKVQVGDASMQLNGAGIRTKWFFKIYVGALYLPQRQTSADAIIADEREHRMALHILHELSGEKLFNAFNDAIEANHTRAELAALNAQINQMAQIFESVREVQPGDIITLDYLPASGTKITVNGTVRGNIAGVSFNRALLRIWLGSKPVQEDLKRGLLGG